MRFFLQRAGLVLFGLALAWLILEAIVRLSGAAEPPQLGADFDRSPALFFAEPERQHPWTEGAADPFRIAVIGDSFTVGQGVQVDDAYPARLERLLNLNAAARPVEVRTYARVGTSTHDQLRFLRQAVAEEPDMILLGIFLNDPENDRVGKWRADVAPRVPSGWKLELLRASKSAAWIYQRLESRRIQRAWIDYVHKLYQPDFQGWKSFEHSLEVFANTSRGTGIPLVAFILPPPGTLGADYPFEFAHQSIQLALSRQEIPFFDLLEIFRDHSGPRLSVLPGVDGHYNEIGHRMTAEAIFGYLLKSGHLSLEYNPRLATPQPARVWLKRLRDAKSVLPPD